MKKKVNYISLIRKWNQTRHLWQNNPSFATCTFVYRTEVSRKKSYKCAKIQIKSHVPSCHFHMYETRLEIDNPCVTFFSVPFSVWRDDVERRRKFSVLYWSKGKTNPKTNISVINKSKWRRKFIDFFYVYLHVMFVITWVKRAEIVS